MQKIAPKYDASMTSNHEMARNGVSPSSANMLKCTNPMIAKVNIGRYMTMDIRAFFRSYLILNLNTRSLSEDSFLETKTATQ